jgi:hypothetical protein
MADSAAKQALSDYAFNRQVTVEWGKLDRNGRTVGKVLDGQQDVNLALVRDDMCWWYRKYAGEQSAVDRSLYEAAEAKAKTERAGPVVGPGPALGVAQAVTPPMRADYAPAAPVTRTQPGAVCGRRQRPRCPPSQ